MSKTVKNSVTCCFVFKQGKNKGKKCGKGCRGKFCWNHKPNKVEYKQKWYMEKKQNEKNKKLQKIMNITDIEDLPGQNKYILKIRIAKDEISILYDKIDGILISLGEDKEEIENKRLKRKYGKCSCSKNFSMHITKKDIMDEVIDRNTRIEFDSKMTSEDKARIYKNYDENEIKKSMRSSKKCLCCDGYDLKNCRFCNHGNIKPIPQYCGLKRDAEKDKKKYIGQIEELNEKINLLQKMHNLVEMKRSELYN